MKDKRTTILGILAIVSAATHAAIGYFTDGSMPDFAELATAIVGFIGLFAADGGK